MAVKVILTFTSGSLKGRQCEFTGPARYVLGRSVDCDVLLPTTPEFMEVSRHHFMLDIDPPAVQVRDLRSRNGTFLNGRDIGLGPPGAGPGAPAESEWHPLEEGDELHVGRTTLHVAILVNRELERVI